MPSRPIAVFLHDTVGLISGVLKGSVRRIMAASSIQNADGSRDVTVTTDGAQERLDVSAALDKPLPAGTNNIGDVDVVSSALPTGAATEATLGTLLTEATFNAEDFATQTTLVAANQNLIDIETLLTSIKDTDGIKKITDALPVGDNILGRVKLTDGTEVVLIESNGALRAGIYGDAGVNPVDVSLDGVDGKYRLEIQGKVSVSAPPTPPAATPISIGASSPLAVTTTSTTTYVIPNGETLTITSVTAGAEGDPNERGSKVEVFFYNGTEHIVERIYLTGQTVPLFPDTSQARDGTALVGNGTNEIRVRRTRLGGSSVEIDAVVRGYLT